MGTRKGWRTWMLAAMVAAGCGIEGGDGGDGGIGGSDDGEVDTAIHEQVPADFVGVHWLHSDVSGWAETATLGVTIADDRIFLAYDKANVWPGRGGLNANPWIFVFRDDRWYAATFEWFRVGQQSKPTRTVAGDHIKRHPLENFQPVSGEIYGFMVSGLARDSTRNVEERTPVVMHRWP